MSRASITCLPMASPTARAVASASADEACARHHLHQPHDRGGVEEVQAHHALGVRHAARPARSPTATRCWWPARSRPATAAASAANSSCLSSSRSGAASMTMAQGASAATRRRPAPCGPRSPRPRRRSSGPWPPAAPAPRPCARAPPPAPRAPGRAAACAPRPGRPAARCPAPSCRRRPRRWAPGPPWRGSLFSRAMRRTSTGVVPAALGATFLVLVAFTSAITTAPDTAGSFGAGIAWQTWILSSMSLGLAGALMTVRRPGRRARRPLGHGRRLRRPAGARPCWPRWRPASACSWPRGCSRASPARRCWWPRWGSSRWPCPPGPERTRATGLWGAMVGAGIAAGPAAGGPAGRADRTGGWCTGPRPPARWPSWWPRAGCPTCAPGCATRSTRPARSRWPPRCRR